MFIPGLNKKHHRKRQFLEKLCDEEEKVKDQSEK
jgi:hypothetical protein